MRNRIKKYGKKEIGMMDIEQKTKKTENVAYNTYVLTEKMGMSIAGITVGILALSYCLFAYNWLTFLLSIVGIFLSAYLCITKRKNNMVSMISIILSSAGLLLGIIVSPEVLASNVVVYGVLWVVEKMREVGGVIREILRSWLLIVF